MKKGRKNYLPALVLDLILWVILGLMLIYVEPELVKDILAPGLYLPFFVVFFPASLIGLALIIGNTRKGVLGSLGLTGFLILQIYDMGNVLNLLLITSILIAVDKYLDS